MAATSHRKLSRKTLKQPDEFVSSLDWLVDFIARNITRVILGAVAVVAAVAIGFAFSFYSQHRRGIASAEFYDAINSLSDKNYQTAVSDFGALARNDSGTSLGDLAELYLASTYLAQNQPSKARDALRAYLADSSNRLFRQVALTQLGVANEDLGDYRDAHIAYSKAAQLSGPEKGRAQIGAARTLAHLGDRQGAIKAYQEFLRENPFTPPRTEVIEVLAQMGVSPEPQGSETVTPMTKADRH